MNGEIDPSKNAQYVVFLTPAFDHNVTIEHFASVLQSCQLLNQRGTSTAHILIGGDPYLAKVRNALVTRALREHPLATDFFFLDADTSWDPKHLLTVLDSPYDIAGGIYPKKSDVPDFPVHFVVSNPRTVTDPATGQPEIVGDLIEQNGWYKAEGLPTGFMCIKRRVLEQMATTCGRYDDPLGKVSDCINFFEMGYCADNVATTGKGEWWGEDFAFCRKARLMGFELWFYADIDFGHRGTKLYQNNIMPSMEAFKAKQRKLKEMTMGEPEIPETLPETTPPAEPASPPVPVEPEVPVETPPLAPPEAVPEPVAA